jgi:hypothetical protein
MNLTSVRLSILLAGAGIAILGATTAHADPVTADDVLWVPFHATTEPGFGLEPTGTSLAPFLENYTGAQDFQLFTADAQAAGYPTSDLLGTVNGTEDYTTFFGGASNFNFVVSPTDPIGQPGDLGDFTSTDLPTGFVVPTANSVYDVFNMGSGYENVYTDIASTTGSNTIADEFITPFGDVNLTPLVSSFDAVVGAGGPEADWFNAFDLGSFGDVSSTAAATASDGGGFLTELLSLF